MEKYFFFTVYYQIRNNYVTSAVISSQWFTFVVTAAVGGEFLVPVPGEPGDPGEPGCSEAVGGEDRLGLVELEKDSLKLGLCLPDKLDFPDKTSFSSASFTEKEERQKQESLTGWDFMSWDP